MTTPSPEDAIERRIGRIRNTLHPDDLDEALADANGYIDAARDFGHISDEDNDRFSREARQIRDETAAKLLKKQNARRR